MDTHKLFEQTVLRLKNAKVKNAYQETEILFIKALGNDFRISTPLSSEKLEKAIALREQRVPIERIFGMTEFCGIKICIEDNVFKPYPESEDFVYYVSESIKEKFPNNNIKILDVGTGTGCLLLALLKEFPNAFGTGIDISEKALELASKNAVLNDIDRVSFIKNDWCDDLNEKFHVIISNPPRARTRDIPNLLPEMKNHDPIISLDGGEDGLNFIKRLADSFKNISYANSICLCQISQIYAKEAEQLFADNGFRTSIKTNFFKEACCIIAEM